MKFRIKVSKASCFYFILLTAYLNAVLRISPESNLTLFRILIPFSVLLIYFTSKKQFSQFLFAGALLFISQLCLHLLTSRVFFRSVTFSTGYFLQYFFHYGSFLILFYIILCLKKLEGDAFYTHFSAFAELFVKGMALFILLYTVILNRQLNTIPTADNINNIGCMLAAGSCLILVKAGHDRKQYIWSLLILFLLYYNDSKAALFGAIVAILVHIIIVVSSKIAVGKLLIRRLFILAGMMMAAYVIYRSPVINGYSLSELTAGVVMRVLRNQPYEFANTSITYRTNSTIAALNIIKRTWGLGTGFGNTARALKEVMKNVYPTWASSVGYSLHNWWLELMCDFGLPAIFTETVLFLEAMKALLYKKLDKDDGRLSTLFLLSFPFWSISASGLTTEFYSLSVLIFALLITGSTSGKRLVFIKSVENH